MTRDEAIQLLTVKFKDVGNDFEPEYRWLMLAMATSLATIAVDALLEAGITLEPPSLGGVWTDADGRRWREAGESK